MFHADDVAETQNDAHCQRGKGYPPVHRGAALAVELSDKPVGLAVLLLYSVHEWNNRSGNHGMDPPVSQSCIGAARAKKLWQAAKQLYRKKKRRKEEKFKSRGTRRSSPVDVGEVYRVCFDFQSALEPMRVEWLNNTVAIPHVKADTNPRLSQSLSLTRIVYR